MPYDVFISYRRITGANDARLLQQALKARGYEVFFDYDSLRDGQFDKRIFAAIDEAPPVGLGAPTSLVVPSAAVAVPALVCPFLLCHAR